MQFAIHTIGASLALIAGAVAASFILLSPVWSF